MKSRKEAVLQLERIRTGLEKKCVMIVGNLHTPLLVKSRYDRACSAFRNMFGDLPTLGEIALVCYPNSMYARNLKKR